MDAINVGISTSLMSWKRRFCFHFCVKYEPIYRHNQASAFLAEDYHASLLVEGYTLYPVTTSYVVYVTFIICCI